MSKDEEGREAYPEEKHDVSRDVFQAFRSLHQEGLGDLYACHEEEGGEAGREEAGRGGKEEDRRHESRHLGVSRVEQFYALE